MGIDTEFHQEALTILRVINHSHGKADLLPIPFKKQIMPFVMIPAADLIHLIAVFFPQKIVPVFAVRVREDVPDMVGIQLLPEMPDFLGSDRFPHCHFVHGISSNFILEG